MPKGSNSENGHLNFRERPHDHTSTSTINSVGSARSNATTEHNIGSAKSGPFNDREYSNVQIDSTTTSKTLILSKFFNTNNNKTDNNNPAYENLCSGCGYGVFEARGELCNFCQYILNGCPEDNTNNIYENICDKCSQLFSGDECLVCLDNNKHNKKYDNNVKSTSKKKLKKRLIHSLLGSLKRVKSFNAASTPQTAANLKLPNRKLQIVHNVDGFENVFCTNETFDLSRICELKLKQQKQLKASTSDHHIYGKLRISDDDHLHQARFECIKQKSQSHDYLISGTVAAVAATAATVADSCSCDPLFCSTSFNSHDSFDNNNSSYLHIRNSVSEWMTSLRCETHDYYSFGAPDTILSNPKSIPGNFTELCSASSFIFNPRHLIYPAYDQMQRQQATTKSSSFLDEFSQVEITQRMVNEFKRNLMEKPGPHSIAHKQHLRTKRHGIHLKLDDIENIQRANNNNYQPVQVVDVVVDHNKHNDLVWMVGDHQQQRQRQRNDNNNCLLQPTAQVQAIALAAAGLNGGRCEPEHQLNKRCCIYEKDSEFVSDILQVFDSILLRESHNSLSSSFPSSSLSSSSLSPSSLSPSPSTSSSFVELRNCENSQVVNEVLFDIVPHSTSDSNTCLVSFPQKFNFEQILFDLVLSKSLNKIVINYDISLKLFLSGIDKSAQLSHLTYPILKKIFRRFQVFLCKQKRNVVQIRMKILSSNDCCSRSEARSLLETSQNIPAIEYNSIIKEKVFSEIDSLNNIKMTVPNGSSNTKAEEDDKEEPIYQPIWKFKTVGEVQETDITDVYYDDHHMMPSRCDSYNSLTEIQRAAADIEDHDEWVPDDEFTFTTELDMRANAHKEADTISVNTIQSSSGSTITGYASSVSTMTLASTSSSAAGTGNFTHHLLRNICIFYSPKYPTIRAVLYEYDRNRSSSYFAQQMPSAPPLPLPLPLSLSDASSSSSSSLPSMFNKKAGRGNTNGSTPTTSADYYDTRRSSPYDGNKFLKKSSESGNQILADSVQAWKYLLLDVNYLEDEEDMIVSESQILKTQTIKEMDNDVPRYGILQRFKSISSGSLLDMPAEEDKKSITERMRNKFQRGVFKLHPRSPKEGKKGRKNLKGKEATSLYLEDGMQPKYPIFKAPLESLEMNETSYPDVPRFVVDCITYIEQKDCIQMDGLYRASGNKLAIDELKQKLTESYIYDPKLLLTDDIHTLTSLLKMFFRELGTPLIPHDTYKCFAPTSIEDMRKAFQTMQNPNRETLKFLIKHLTTVAHYSSENRMPASNLAIVWGPCILAGNHREFDIARMNTIAKVLIENYDQIFGDNERLVS